MLKGKRKDILSAIASAPRKPQHFTHGVHKVIHPDILKAYLDEMLELGYVVEDEGVYHITMLGRSKLDTASSVALPRQFVSTDRYVPENMTPMRPGADDHKQYSSRGF